MKKEKNNIVKRELPKSLRKHIREEKSRIRREILNTQEQQEKIKKLLDRFYKNLSKESG